MIDRVVILAVLGVLLVFELWLLALQIKWRLEQRVPKALRDWRNL